MALSMECSVGYIAAEDVYVVYREYYGDGTIYGRVDLLLNGEPVRGAGKSKKELVEAGVVLSDNVIGSIGGDLVGVPDSNELAPEPLPEPELAPEPLPELAPELAHELAPELAPEVACACVCGPACICACACAPECACVVAQKDAPVCACACGSACACACACSPDCACVTPSSPVEASPCCSGRYTVSMVIAGFTVTRELNVKINEESRQIYLSD